MLSFFRKGLAPWSTRELCPKYSPKVLSNQYLHYYRQKVFQSHFIRIENCTVSPSIAFAFAISSVVCHAIDPYLETIPEAVVKLNIETFVPRIIRDPEPALCHSKNTSSCRNDVAIRQQES